MTAFWHPLSAVYLHEPRMLSSVAVLRLLLAGEGRATVVYAGDRMWPAVRHGQRLTVVPLGTEGPRLGEVVVAADAGAPDVVRLVAGAGGIAAVADADPAEPKPVSSGELVGRVEGAWPGAAEWRALRRAWLDVREAWTGRPDPADDAATTVREKYDDQAPFYARSGAVDLEGTIRERLRAHLPAGGRVLVAGCGAGRETFAVEAMGFEAVGIDFAPRMIDAAKAEGRRRGSRASFVTADLREHAEPPRSLAGILFTYDVYSFLPASAARVALLRRMRQWLAADGVLVLSARRSRAVRDRALIGLQWASRALRGRPGEWGDSHARRLDPAGRVRRSFVHVFSPRSLDREASKAGFEARGWDGGHGLYATIGSPTPDGPA